MKHVMLCLLVLLAACGRNEKIIEKPVPIEKTELIVPDVRPVEQYDFEWIVVTQQNFAEVVKNLESKGQTVVLFAVTPQGYQNLSMNIAELRSFIVQQQSVIVSYKTYYGKKNEE